MHGWTSMGVRAPLSLSPGEYRLEATCELTLPEPAGGLPVAVPVRAQGDLTIVGPEVATVNLVHDEEGARLFTQILTFEGHLYDDGREPYLSMGVGEDPTKAESLMRWARAHRAVFEFDWFIQPLDGSLPEVQARAPVAIRCNDDGLSLGGPVFSVGPEYGPGRYRLRLVPNQAAAEESMADENMYGDEITLEIDVRGEPRPMAPAPRK